MWTLITARFWSNTEEANEALTHHRRTPPEVLAAAPRRRQDTATTSVHGRQGSVPLMDSQTFFKHLLMSPASPVFRTTRELKFQPSCRSRVAIQRTRKSSLFPQAPCFK